jgi:hypothetical protein
VRDEADAAGVVIGGRHGARIHVQWLWPGTFDK